MSASDAHADSLNRCIELLKQTGAPTPAIESFTLHFNRAAADAPEYLSEEDIQPIDDLADTHRFGDYRKSGEQALHRVAVIKLNGGLGTGMGLDRAKSLLDVRDGLSFLDLIARQVLAVRARTGAAVPLILMNSARTAAETEAVLSRIPALAHPGLPHGFLQNRIPKILASNMAPAGAATRDRAWCPPGHGDLYTAIAGSGMLELLLNKGFEYAFVSNADNLGAVLDTGILGYMVENDHDFVMEAADRSAADRKGGHLCRRPDGRLALRESAQCRPEDEAAFQDIERHRFFNTNNLWVRLPALDAALAANGGYLPLDTIVNRKRLNPRDPSSPEVLQLETAMGAAISIFDRTAAVRVPRRRFSPVKNTDDLLAVRSDAFQLTDDWLVVLHPERETPPVISLDDRYYKMIDDFEARFPSGPPSLRRCDRLTVEGEVTFAGGVVVEGEATVTAAGRAAVTSGALLTGEIRL